MRPGSTEDLIRILPEGIGSIVEMVEQDLGLPMVAALTARCCEIQRRLNVPQKIPGFGRLLAEMPDG